MEAHTPEHVIGWERVDADTDTENDRHAYQPQGRPRTPNPHRSLSNRASSTWLPAHKCAAARPEDSCDLPKISPRDAEVGGWASRDRRGPARADDARRQPLGRKKAGNQDLESTLFPPI